MTPNSLLLVVCFLAVVSFVVGRNRSLVTAESVGGQSNLHSLPQYYGYMTAIMCAIPALILLFLWVALEPGVINRALMNSLPSDVQALNKDQLSLYINDIKLLSSSAEIPADTSKAQSDAVYTLRELTANSRWLRTISVILLAMLGALYAWRQIHPEKRARVSVERTVLGILIACSCVAIFTTIGIVLSVLFESIRFFGEVDAREFLFGTNWSPQMAIRADQVGSSGSFGAIPLFVGTILISFIAMIVAVPLGLMSAIYLSEYASKRFRSIAKPMLEILAGVPTVVYGFFAALTVAPMIRKIGESIGLNVASESALAAGLVMGVMIIPFVSSLSDDVIAAVPMAMREGSYGMGATKSETIKQVVLPAALPGIVGGVLLAVSRAIGETMIVVMAAGLAANMTVNPLEAVTTVTVQIVTLLTGDQEFDSAKTLAAFALGLMLFVSTLVLNMLALNIVRKYREQYE